MKTIIFGCGGHSRSVTDIILLEKPEASLIFVDDNAKDQEKLFGFEVVRRFPIDNNPCFVAIGDNLKRMLKLAELAGHRVISVISPRAHIGLFAEIDQGCFVGNFCHIGPEAKIGVGTILNTSSVVEHEVHVGNYCHIGPNATISGRSEIGNHVFVGVGAVIKDNVKVCPNVIVGAGATVVKDITEPGTYTGTPARRVK